MKKQLLSLSLLALAWFTGSTAWAQSEPAQDSDGWYLLGTVDDVEWFGQQVMDGKHATIKGKLTADIDYEGVKNRHQPIGRYGQKFVGKFDGQGHRILNMVLNDPTLPKGNDDGTGFFGCVRVGGDGFIMGSDTEKETNDLVEIKNLIIDASCTITSSRANTAGLVGRISEKTTNNTVLIENCINEATINTTAAAPAGIVGQINNAADGNVIIRNCVNKGSVTTSGLAAAGIISQINNCTVNLTIESCMNFANITSTGSKNCGGIFGANTSSKATIKINNCGNTGNVTGTEESAALTGWIGSNAGQVISNCWNSGTVTGGSTSTNMYRDQNSSTTVTNIYNKYGEGGQGTVITDEMIASGELCYKLNGDQSAIAWTQTLDGTQEYPLPVADGAQVYKADDTFCDLSVRHYSNYESGHVFGHNINDEIGMCDVCHTQFQEPDFVDDFYQIRNAGNVEWISAQVASGTLDPDCKLMNDIDMLGIENLHSPIGPSNGNKYNGTFDGQGFRIKNMIINRPSAEMQGFFGSLRGNPNTKGQGTVIKNLIIDKSCSITGGLRTAAITGAGQNNEKEIVIMNCVNEASVTSSSKNVAGIVGGSHSNHPIWKLTNCVNVGKITCTASDHEAAGIAAWLGDNGNTRVTNCINIGEVTNGNNGSGMDSSGRGVFRHSNSDNTAVNCHDISGMSGASQFIGQGLTTNDALNGKATYTINEAAGSTVYWQTIGTDNYPMPFNSSQQVREANTGNYTNLTVSESAVQIGSAANLNKFAAEVNAGNTSMNAVLTSNVDMSSVTYTPIGNNANRYHGTFDGSGHKVNLNIDANAYGQGFISIATGGVTVKNLVVTGSVKNSGSKTAGIIAEAIGGGVVTIQNCGNEATIQGTSGETAAIIANNWGYQCTLNIENVYNIGDVSGSGDVSTICACQGNPASVFKNVYNSGSVTGATQGNFVRPSNSDRGTYTNCYSTTLSNDNASIISTNTSAVESGELCYKLGTAFTQDLSQTSYPTFGSKQVILNGNYENVATTLTLNDANSFGTNSDFDVTSVTMTRTLKGEKWNTFCVPFGMTSEEISAQFGADAKVKELSGATLNGENYNMTFSDASTIVAGKPYMVRVSNEVTSLNLGAKTIKGTITPATAGDVTFTGVYNNGNAPLGSFIISNNVFYLVDTDTNTDGISEVALKAFRGYITVDSGSGVKALTFDFEDDATGIENLNVNDNLNEGAIYNLSGQRINKMQKGINIINGKKILK